MTEEEIAPRFAALLTEAADTHGAPSFAGTLAYGGAKSPIVRGMAQEWRTFHFEPSSFADKLDAFADELDANDE